MATRYTIDEILTPLALTVIIDNKVRDPELMEFTTQAEGLCDALDDFDPMSPAAVLEWYRENESTLIGHMNGRGKNTFILKTLTRFTDNAALVEAMYDAMLAISVSDKEYRVEESELIRSAASLWGYIRPPFKVVGRK